MRISLIASVGEGNFVIGDKGKIPWELPADLRRFRELTIDKPIIMGRKTFESIGKPLPKRFNIVVTKNTEIGRMLLGLGCDKVDYSFEGALNTARTIAIITGCNEIFVIGGESIYRQALMYADRLYLTFVHDYFRGDTYFPIDGIIDWRNWKEIFNERHEADERNSHSFTYRVFDKEI